MRSHEYALTSLPDEDADTLLSARERRLITSIGLAVAAVLVGLSLIPMETGNAAGMVGVWIRQLLTRAIGITAWVIPFELANAAWNRLEQRPLWSRPRIWSRAATWLLASVLFHLTFAPERPYSAPVGGWVGSVLGEFLRTAFGVLGVTVLGAFLAWTTWMPRRLGQPSSTTVDAKPTTPRARVVEPPRLEPRRLAAAPQIRIASNVPAGKSTCCRTRRVLCLGQPFELPSSSLLKASSTRASVDRARLNADARKLVEALAERNITGDVVEICCGPRVTTYEFAPSSKSKVVSTIAASEEDLSLLFASDVRIIAPIPGKARVGFELPNKQHEIVSLRQLLEDRRWDDAQAAALPVVIGSDTAGQPVYADLAQMPHLLIGGATGGGKSVGLNVILTSLLFARTPEQLRLILIDQKMVEFAAYAEIPHLLRPVVTEPGHALAALRWAIGEMERRYEHFSRVGARNLESYHERLAMQDATPKTEDGNEPNTDIRFPLPHVVIVVDEFADLLMAGDNEKDIEATIQRLTQKGRAAGIHLILATQRPSVDVIKGRIKANFRARIAFKVSQDHDSKTILGCNGAERLLGNGDMLIMCPESTELRRLHGAFVSEQEVESICDFLRRQSAPEYGGLPLESEAQNNSESEDDEFAKQEVISASRQREDPLYAEAVALVSKQGRGSVSFLQRALGIGYPRAAKLLDTMEARKVQFKRTGPGRPPLKR